MIPAATIAVIVVAVAVGLLGMFALLIDAIIGYRHRRLMADQKRKLDELDAAERALIITRCASLDALAKEMAAFQDEQLKRHLVEQELLRIDSFRRVRGGNA